MPNNPTTPKVLFPADLPPENVVRAVLAMLQSYYERELECVNNTLADFPDFFTDKLAITWLRIRAGSQSDVEALCVFTKVITAELDGGNSPEWPPPR